MISKAQTRICYLNWRLKELDPDSEEYVAVRQELNCYPIWAVRRIAAIISFRIDL